MTRTKWALFVLLFVSYAYFYQAGGWNQNSRFDLVRAIVEQRTTRIDGYVENTGGGTGAVASVLPPENATGNFVKVVQRIPVRLRFKPNQAGVDRLRAGMSAVPEVRIGR